MNQYNNIDYTNYKVDTFKIISRNGTNAQGYALWKGKCECCGAERDFKTSLIKKGHAKECDCIVENRRKEKQSAIKNNNYKNTLSLYLWKKVHNSWHLNPDNLPPKIIIENRENLINTIINNIQILYPCGYNNDNRIIYVCKCFCGNYFLSNHKNLKSGITKSCDCLRNQRVIESNLARGQDIIGTKQGMLFIESIAGLNEAADGHRELLVNCICDCGRKCIKQAIYIRNGDTKSCGICNNHSIGERIIQSFLEEKNINFQHEYRFPDFITPNKGYYRFDFAIFNKQRQLLFLLEYDGEQHFNKKTTGIFAGQYETIHQRDLEKTNYCLKNNIKLVRISYKENLQERLEEIFNGV